MSDSSPCIRCGHAIDAYAKTCVYCNWDQSVTPPPASAQPLTQPAADVVPDAKLWKRRLMFGGILVALAILAFAIGAFVHREEKRPLPVTAEHGVTPPAVVADNRAPRSDVTLIPVTDSAFLETPITSAPAPTATDGTDTNGAQRNDATALPSSEYAAVAERAKAEKQANKSLVDPRSITGSAYDVSGMPPRRPAAAPHRDVPMSSSSAVHAAPKRTPPVPEYQPLPSIHVDRNMTARLRLTIGADGRVKGIAIGDAIPGQTPKLIAAVQNWRFRPATENGVPVEAPFAVDISFHGNE